MNDPTEAHCRELNRCNQRGGRMLSVFDLLKAETLDLDLAAYLMARISKGASFVVGAVPGGAGKTTVMCAMLNFVPLDVQLVAATDSAVDAALVDRQTECRCYICHEIGSGHYFAYLWGRSLRDYCSLHSRGHILATNLHADNPEQTYDQICRQNSASDEDFRRFELLLFLDVQGGYFDPQRRISTVYSSDGQLDHLLIYDLNTGLSDMLESPICPVTPEYVSACRDFLDTAMSKNVRTIEQTRHAVVQFLAQHSTK